MHDEVSAATAMLGLDGFVLLAVSEQDGELEQAVETTTTVDFCRSCGVQARLHDRRPTCGAGPAVGGPAGDVGVGQAGLAVPRVGLPGGDLVGDLVGDPGRGLR